VGEGRLEQLPGLAAGDLGLVLLACVRAIHAQ
jgi:hypothetical protein